MKVLFAQGKGTVVGYVSVAHIIFAIVCQEDGTFINLPLDKIRKDMSDQQRSNGDMANDGRTSSTSGSISGPTGSTGKAATKTKK